MNKKLIFQEDFFEKEVKCGFEISEMTKRAWAAQLEVLSVVDTVCRENDLQYYADFGTLLGAIRHQGFIPWDDDIDISLKREDYDRLIQILPEELPKGFSMAGMYAKEKRLQQAAETQQIRVIADETMWNFKDYMRYFHGFPYMQVGIDIFPLDYFSTDEETIDLQRMIIQYGSVTLNEWGKLQEEGELENHLSRLEEWCKVKLPRNDGAKNSLWKLLDSVCSLYYDGESEEMANFIIFVLRPDYRLKKEWFERTEYKTFENIQIPVPYKWHEVLTAEYGDYMTPVRIKTYHESCDYSVLTPWLAEKMAEVGFHGTVEEFCCKGAKG